MDFLRPSSKKGRSRFSKALPIPPPPPLADEAGPPSDSSHIDSINKISNRSNNIKLLPSIPSVPRQEAPPAMSDKPLPPAQPVNQALPPPPRLETKALPRMHIARRPVATPPKTSSPPPPPPPAMSPTSPQYLQLQPEPSPSGSFGSLLSAYSRSSSESLFRSPDGSSSQRDSVPTYASESDGAREVKILTPSSLSPGDKEASYSRFGANDSAPKFTPSKGLPTSPSPAYREERTQPFPAKPGRAAAAADIVSPASPASASALPQRPIWRRRSMKSDRNIEVTDLKLAISHGSTAASQPNTSKSPHSAVSSSSQQQQKPPRSAAGLPGRNIRPVQSQDQAISPANSAAPAASAAAGEMGQEASRLRNKISRLRGEEGSIVAASHSDTALSTNQRLPTPDYEKEDIKTPVVETVVSPISPASSPEPAPNQAGSDSKAPIPRKAVSVRNLHNAQSLPQMRVDVPVTNSEAPPIIARDFAVSPVSSQAQSQFPARTSSNQQQPRVGQRQPAGREHAPSPGFAQGDHMRPTAKDHRVQEQPVEYRELKEKDLPAADPRAFYFPLHTPEPPSPSIVYDALPLKDSMLDCYVKHRVMDRTRNRNYALTCQTCGKSDSEDRFKCQWCYVRMCASCLRIFNNNRRDLRKLVTYLKENPQSSDSEAQAANGEASMAVATSNQQNPAGGQQQHTQQPQVMAA